MPLVRVALASAAAIACCLCRRDAEEALAAWWQCRLGTAACRKLCAPLKTAPGSCCCSEGSALCTVLPAALARALVNESSSPPEKTLSRFPVLAGSCRSSDARFFTKAVPDALLPSTRTEDNPGTVDCAGAARGRLTGVARSSGPPRLVSLLELPSALALEPSRRSSTSVPSPSEARLRAELAD